MEDDEVLWHSRLPEHIWALFRAATGLERKTDQDGVYYEVLIKGLTKPLCIREKDSCCKCQMSEPMFVLVCGFGCKSVAPGPLL